MSNNIYAQKIVHCKSCHSNKIQLVGNLYYMVSAALFLTTFFINLDSNYWMVSNAIHSNF